jgi:hypothetical protein
VIAALYVEAGGVYFGLDDVDPWDEARDARLYDGNDPVVAHPPCSRWGRLAGLVEARWGHKRGDDGGCFAAALEAVNRCGGVLEHPAFSAAFPFYGIPTPIGVGWQKVGPDRWVAYVEQRHYGHVAKKPTWLYCSGVACPPTLDRRRTRDNESEALVSWCGNRVKSGEKRPRIGHRRASRTPVAFRDLLLRIARMAVANHSADRGV